jgi:[NiFe] hydrogenase assembly HybE family chaperone
MVLGDDHAVPTLPDPSPRLNAAFREAASRMPGALVNPALEVEAVGFAPWEGHWLGVMVTPWFMNLMLLPRVQGRWQTLRVGDKREVAFPAGVYDFIGGSEPSVGEYQSCSLFSPMQQFENHAAARLVAQLAREALLDAANAEPPEDARDARAQPVQPVPISKREFLRGRFAGGDGD